MKRLDVTDSVLRRLSALGEASRFLELPRKSLVAAFVPAASQAPILPQALIETLLASLPPGIALA
jgi:hypothetical protein